jgi:hypothetical protein
MQAYLNNPLLKVQILQQLQAHYDADEIIKGVYWEDGKGCAIGCILHDARGNHERFESEVGIPAVIALLIDRIFEGLSNDKAKQWPLRIMSAFEPGKDYSKAWYQFGHWLLIDPTDGVIRVARSDESRAAIHNVAQAYDRTLKGGKIDNIEWLKLSRDAAGTYDYVCADGYGYAAAAATAAADAGAAATAYAAAAAAAAAVYAAEAGAASARENFYTKMADKLIEIIQASEG